MSCCEDGRAQRSLFLSQHVVEVLIQKDFVCLREDNSLRWLLVWVFLDVSLLMY